MGFDGATGEEQAWLGIAVGEGAGQGFGELEGMDMGGQDAMV